MAANDETVRPTGQASERRGSDRMGVEHMSQIDYTI